MDFFLSRLRFDFFNLFFFFLYFRFLSFVICFPLLLPFGLESEKMTTEFSGETKETLIKGAKEALGRIRSPSSYDGYA